MVCLMLEQVRVGVEMRVRDCGVMRGAVARSCWCGTHSNCVNTCEHVLTVLPGVSSHESSAFSACCNFGSNTGICCNMTAPAPHPIYIPPHTHTRFPHTLARARAHTHTHVNKDGLQWHKPRTIMPSSQIGDAVLEINGVPAAKQALLQLRQLVCGPPGSFVSLLTRYDLLVVLVEVIEAGTSRVTTAVAAAAAALTSHHQRRHRRHHHHHQSCSRRSSSSRGGVAGRS